LGIRVSACISPYALDRRGASLLFSADWSPAREDAGEPLNSVNLSDVFVGMASRWRDRPAIISENLNLSYAELVTRAAQTARELRSRGIAAETNIGIALRDNAESFVLMIAVWMLGATAVPMDFRATTAERNQLAEEFDLTAIIVDREFQASGYVQILIGNAWTEALADREGGPFYTSQQRAVPAFISLTSGTTGRPKGIVIDHERMLLRSLFDAEPIEGPLLNPLPLSFSASRTHAFSALLQGSAVYFYPLLFSAQQLTETILLGRANSLCAVPTIVRNLFELFAERSTPAFAKLKALYCFGAPMSAAEKLRAKRSLCDNFVQVYGASICGRISTLSGADLEAQADSVGRVLPHVTLQLVDADDKPVASGEAGVIRLRSPGMAQRIYGRNASGSGDGFREGWAYPGDIGALDDGGHLRLLGRGSDLIIRGGVNVHPSEVEAAIGELAGVREVAVVGFTKLPEGQEIAAFVVGEDLTEAALAAHCRVRLSPDKRPRRFLFVKDLPRNANGKITRAELRQQLEAKT
jgi:long-chain acyl-CoA synthetase